MGGKALVRVVGHGRVSPVALDLGPPPFRRNVARRPSVVGARPEIQWCVSARTLGISEQWVRHHSYYIGLDSVML